MTDSPGPYEAYPSGPGDVSQPSKPPVPTTINVAFYCYVVSTVIGIVSALLLLGTKDQIADQLRRANTSGLTEDQIQSAAQVALIVAVVIALLFALVYLWLAFKLRAGRNWARITLTVLTVLQVVSLAAGRGGTIVGYLSLLLAVVGLVFAYLGTSNQYINTVKQSRS
ncbi:hypothetical protein LWP59_19575 [Amycolatopsis acidiphila]|uniref:Uncharacterized protein n=1 Tax=Amycolatopsis acidiphila TaxID=715473 RepID=A0A558ACL7_9PSEU|nr:hypothetical protein [Amycolatopsis acidiphila]TVT22012.1 hypothetical protein FNH06_14695 [Amycolatopsis acidiphila]UIJ63672.1 hypothetical protein LWP59_19575 [Amycolatopsis acidiphila]GHG67545.1 hypothetical protein GCM10017788_26500 [Amycolatopsis acidiphila]